MIKRGKTHASGSARLQHRLWDALLTASVVVFFAVAIIFLSSEFGMIRPLTIGDAALLEFGPLR